LYLPPLQTKKYVLPPSLADKEYVIHPPLEKYVIHPSIGNKN